MIGTVEEADLPMLNHVLPRIAEAVVNVIESSSEKKNDIQSVIATLRPIADLVDKVVDVVEKRTGERRGVEALLCFSSVALDPWEIFSGLQEGSTAKTPSDRIANLRKTAGILCAVADIAEMSDVQGCRQDVHRLLILATRANDTGDMSAIEADVLRMLKKSKAEGGGDVSGNADIGTMELLYFCRLVCPEMRPNS